ncbi:unnamed protein product [Spodoptera littoralis]|uniref:Uncharacterized protein n=1 Tax=Spodoptera littoralis TaxID=7109 RepID=A0A9P0I8M0_SPOLI|nr:unnamed protein product [Spodoptera littoralis]CAH1642161.1 unnamed protein product [Spodoptera littoralis]
MATRPSITKTTHKRPVLVTCYRCKKSVNEKQTAMCSVCKNRMEPDCDGYPLQTYRLKSEESKIKWRCSMCTKKMANKVPTSDDNISNITVRKKPAQSLKQSSSHTEIHRNKRKLLSPNQDSHILSDYDTSYETNTTTPNKLLLPSSDDYYEMQDTISQLTAKLESTENELECLTLQNDELNIQVDKLTQEINILKSLCNSSTMIESSPIIINNKKERQCIASQDIFSTPTSGIQSLDVNCCTNRTYQHLYEKIAYLQRELINSEKEIKSLNTQMQILEKSLKTSSIGRQCPAEIGNSTQNTIKIFGAQQCVGLAAALTRSREATRGLK